MKESGSRHAAADEPGSAVLRQGRVGLVLALAAGVAGVLMAWSLGNWQTRRAEGKLAVEQRWQAAEAAAPATPRAAQLQDFSAEMPRRVRLAGRYLHAHSVWLDNRPLDGKAGLLLLTPLVLADPAGERTTAVLVLRGWAPRDPRDRTKLPAVMQPEGQIVVEGLALPNPPRVLELGEGAVGGPLPAIWQNLDYAAFSRVTGLAVAPWIVQQQGGAADGLRRDWPRPSSGVDKHRGYAVQWYSLAGLIAVLTLVLGARALWRTGATAAHPTRPPTQ
jgi:cytochrome oxidase assembly protein ShyY1